MSQSGFSSSPSGLMRRREARRIAMTIMYAQTCTGYKLDEVVQLMRTVRGDWAELPDFSLKLVQAVQRNEHEIEAHIAGVLENWRINRISPVERALLRLGCAEILYFADIPPRVSINEYIELAKVFSNENAPPFINGILDKLVHQTGKPDALKQ
jgi:N utilization substance protein B